MALKILVILGSTTDPVANQELAAEATWRRNEFDLIFAQVGVPFTDTDKVVTDEAEALAVVSHMADVEVTWLRPPAPVPIPPPPTPPASAPMPTQPGLLTGRNVVIAIVVSGLVGFGLTWLGQSIASESASMEYGRPYTLVTAKPATMPTSNNTKVPACHLVFRGKPDQTLEETVPTYNPLGKGVKVVANDRTLPTGAVRFFAKPYSKGVIVLWAEVNPRPGESPPCQ